MNTEGRHPGVVSVARYFAYDHRIASALHASLPGGTWDRLVATMVARHATVLRVRRPE